MKLKYNGNEQGIYVNLFFLFSPPFLKKVIINKLKTHQLHRKIVKDNKPHSGTHTLETLHPLCVS